jgi:hypothetical protein
MALHVHVPVPFCDSAWRAVLFLLYIKGEERNVCRVSLFLHKKIPLIL